MSKLSISGDMIEFYCEGCERTHVINHTWQFNGDNEKPTFQPSVLANGGESGRNCHSFITDGVIKYLGDCTHDLKDTSRHLLDREQWPKDVFVFTDN
jgi:hypothetical protein